MGRALFLDDDITFVINAQKFLPKGTEWLATTELDKAVSLFSSLEFDTIIVRKQNQEILNRVVAKIIGQPPDSDARTFKRVVVLPHFFWRHYLKQKTMDNELWVCNHPAHA